MEQNHPKTTGTLYGIGVGPGDPGLLTLAAIQTIEQADILCLPNASAETCAAFQIAQGALPELDQKEALWLDVQMTKDPGHASAQRAANYARLHTVLAEGRQVAYLTIGDPTIYSTFTDMANRARADGFAVKTISGIPSFCAAAAVAGIPLAAGSDNIHILSGRVDLHSSLRLDGTKIIMKIGADVTKLKQELQDLLAEESFLVCAVSDVGKPNEQVFYGLDAIPDTIPYMTIVIVRPA